MLPLLELLFSLLWRKWILPKKCWSARNPIFMILRRLTTLLDGGLMQYWVPRNPQSLKPSLRTQIETTPIMKSLPHNMTHKWALFLQRYALFAATSALFFPYVPFWTPRSGRSYKIPSVCMSVCMSVCLWQLPSLNHAYNFADFWHEGRGPLV